MKYVLIQFRIKILHSVIVSCPQPGNYHFRGARVFCHLGCFENVYYLI